MQKRLTDKIFYADIEMKKKKILTIFLCKQMNGIGKRFKLCANWSEHGSGTARNQERSEVEYGHQ